MELRQLQYFIALADSLNFSRAAEALYIAQPTLSQQIHELEEELGVELFIRDRRRVEITPAGSVLLGLAKDVLKRVEEMVDTVRGTGAADGAGGRIAIGCEENILDYAPLRRVLTRALARVKGERPGFSFFYRLYGVHGLDTALKSGEVDLGFCLRPAEYACSGCSKQIIRHERLCAVFYSDRPVPRTAEEIRALFRDRPVFLVEHELNGLKQIVRLFGKMELTPRIQFLDSSAMIALTVESGEGIMLVPEYVANRHTGEGVHSVPLPHRDAHLHLAGLWRPDCANPVVPQLMALLGAEADENPRLFGEKAE